MRKLRIGIVGLGRVSTKTHVPVLRSLEDVEIVAGADNNPERAQRVKDLFGLRNVYESYEEMYSSEELDAVYVCLPTFLHKAACMAALERGFHVLCEKPMGVSSAEAEEITELAEARKLVLMPGYKKRYAANFARAKQIINRGLLGNILHVQGTFLTPGPYISWDPKSEWYLDEKWHGTIYDVGCHIVDLLLYIVPGEITRTATFSRNGFCGYNTPTNVSCVFEMDGGIVGDLSIGWRLSTDVISLSVHGTAGSITVSRDELSYINPATDPIDRILAFAGGALKETTSLLRKVLDKVRGQDFYMEDLIQARAFCKAARGESLPPIDGRSAVRVHRFLEQIVLSSVETDDTVHAKCSLRG